jgi:hypothetical protein
MEDVMKKMILETVMLFSVVDAMEIPEGYGSIQRAAELPVDARLLQEVQRQIAVQNGDRAVSDRETMIRKASLQRKLEERDELQRNPPHIGNETIPVTSWWTTGLRDNNFHVAKNSFWQIEQETGYPIHGFTWVDQLDHIWARWDNPVINRFLYRWHPEGNAALNRRKYNEAKVAYDTKVSQLNREIEDLIKADQE